MCYRRLKAPRVRAVKGRRQGENVGPRGQRPCKNGCVGPADSTRGSVLFGPAPARERNGMAHGKKGGISLISCVLLVTN